MISKQNFINKIKTDVFSKLISTEQQRKSIVTKLYILGSILTAIFLFLGFITKDRFVNSDFTLLILLTIGIFCSLCYIGIGIMANSFIQNNKEMISLHFLKLLGNLRNTQRNITPGLIRDSFIFPLFDKISIDDSLSGHFGDTEFSAVEVELIYGSGKGQRTVFRGIYIDIPMRIPVSGYTLLFNTKIPQKFPILNKISLEDTTFKKNYQVFSDNQIDARILLTPAFMERLNELKKCFRNKRIDVSFFDNHAVFAIHTNQDLFESYSLFRTLTNIKTYENFYDEIKSIHEMIDVLNINNKSLPTDRIFNHKLYHSISALRKPKFNYRPLLILLLILLQLFWGILIFN